MTPRWIHIAAAAMLMVCPRLAVTDEKASSKPSASRPARPRVKLHDGPPVIGVRLNEPVVVENMVLLESGDPAEAIRHLRAAAKSGRGRSLAQLNEVRLGLGIALVRNGQVAEGRKLILPLTRQKQSADLARAADVIHEIAARRASTGKRGVEWCDPVAWGAEFARTASQLQTQVRRAHDDVDRELSRGGWAALAKGIDRLDGLIARVEAIDAEAARLAQRDLYQMHAGLLSAVVRRFNVAIADGNQEVSRLAGQMSMRSDNATRRRGYLPADAVHRYNAAIDRLSAVIALGERCVASYQTLVATHAGDIKKDTTVRLSRTTVPAKRTVFGP